MKKILLLLLLLFSFGGTAHAAQTAAIPPCQYPPSAVQGGKPSSCGELLGYIDGSGNYQQVDSTHGLPTLGGSGGDASAANQLLQLTQETASAAALGTTADAAWSGSGNATVVATTKYIGTSAAATAAVLGTTADTACATDNGTCSLAALSKRGNQRLTTINTTLGSPLQAGCNVGGFEFDVSTNPTVQNASYSSGNCMGGFQTVAVARTSGGTGLLNTLTIMSKGGSVVAMQFYIFQQNPSSSTCTDKSTFTLNAADLPNLIATFSLTPAAPTGTTVTYAEASGLARAFTTNGNSNIYVAIVAGGTVTPASTSDLIFNVMGPRD
jgi:hypothetical protein